METQNRKVKPARKGYVINRTAQTRGYADFRISFVRASRWDAERPEFAKLMLRWQANDSAMERSDWYGLHAEMDCDRLENFVEEAKLATQVSKLMVGYGDSPADFITQLEAAGYVRHVRDARVYPDLVPADRVLPADFKKWVPSYQRLGWDSVHVSAVARDESTAKAMILQELASHGSQYGANEQSAKRCKEYLDAGMPVQLASYSEGPDMTSTADLLMSPKAKQAKLEATAETQAA